MFPTPTPVPPSGLPEIEMPDTMVSSVAVEAVQLWNTTNQDGYLTVFQIVLLVFIAISGMGVLIKRLKAL